MKSRIKFYLAAMFGLVLALGARAQQQQPILGVDITEISHATSVTTIAVTNGGLGYTSAPTVTIAPPVPPNVTDPVIQARAIATVSGGRVTSVTIVNGGFNYQTPPAVSFSGGGGSGAAASTGLGTTFSPPNEVSGAAGVTIGITARATGTFLTSSYTYSYFVNGISIGRTDAPIPPTALPPTVYWTPPQPGSYFITVTATDGVSTATSLAVRYFATGTIVNSPLTNTLVPAGSSVVLKADATVAQGFIREIRFFSNGQPIGEADPTFPYSMIYPVPGGSGGVHEITAQAVDNDGNLVSMSPPIRLQVVTPILPLPISRISSPADGAVIQVPTGDPVTPIPIIVDATSLTGFVGKVETYIDGMLFGTRTSYPYTFEWRPNVIGTYRIVALTYDDKNNVIASAISKVAIASPPSVSITTPANNAIVTEGVLTTLTATATDSNVDTNGNPLTITSVEFIVDGKVEGIATEPTAGNTFSAQVKFKRTVDEDGNAVSPVVTALATNSASITALSPAIRVSVKQGGGGTSAPIGMPPTVSITSPAAGSQLAVNKSMALTAVADDPDGNIVSVEFLAGGVTLAVDTVYPYSASWTPTSLGNYALTAKATDSNGNLVTSAPISVKVIDPAPGSPSVAISSPLNGASLKVGIAQTLRATAIDAGSVASVEFFVNGESRGAADTTFPFETTWTPLTPGIYTVAARAINASGNQATSPAVLVLVSGDALPPTVSLTWPAPGTQLPVNQSVVVTAKADDADGNVASVQFFANATLIASVAAHPYSTSWTPANIGSYNLTAVAMDNTGSVVTSAPVKVIVVDPAPNPPEVRISSPTNGSNVQVGSAQTLRATATDAVSVKSVQFFVNGELRGEADTMSPFEATWSPLSPGIYTITARAINASGNQATSPAVLVSVTEMAEEEAGDAIFTGTYVGAGETGNFALAGDANAQVTFIAYSTTPGANKIYRYAEVPIDVSGGYALLDSAGRSLLVGSIGETGTSGMMDGARLTFIGFETGKFPAAKPVASGQFTGKITSRASSSLTGLLGADGSIMLYVEDGAFRDAGSGKVDAAGGFNFASARGNRFTGKADPVSFALTGTLSGANGGEFSAAVAGGGSSSSDKVGGQASEVDSNIVLPTTGKTYDQVLLQGAAASITADPGQVTRLSYVDLSDDIVQVEFSGAGRLSIELENASGPKLATNYNQPNVVYMKGHAGIVITGADETTNVSIFSVGTITALNQAIFRSEVNYDGVADLAYLVIVSKGASGKFGGVRAANANFVGAKGMIGIVAPGVEFVGPVYVGDINTDGAGNPMLLLGSAGKVQINGGSLWQNNLKAVQVSGVSRLEFVDGMTSRGTLLPAQFDQSRLEQNGVDVTTQIVVNPGL